MEKNSLVCRACLSSDRVLYKSSNMKTLLAKMDIQINDFKGNEMCWECRTLVRKFIKFKSQVHEAQETLNNVDKLKNLKSLSSLACSKTQTVNIPSTESTTGNTNEIDKTLSKSVSGVYHESQSNAETRREHSQNTPQDTAVIHKAAKVQNEHILDKTEEAHILDTTEEARVLDSTAEKKPTSNKQRDSRDHLPKITSVESIKDKNVSMNENSNHDETSVIYIDDNDDSNHERKYASKKELSPTNQGPDGMPCDADEINVPTEDTNSNWPKITMVKSIEDDDIECIPKNDSRDLIELNIPIPCIIIDDDDDDFKQQDVGSNRERQLEYISTDAVIQVDDYADVIRSRTRDLDNEDVIIEDSSIWTKAIKQEKIDDLTAASEACDSDMKSESIQFYTELDTTPEFSIEVKAEPMSPEPDLVDRDHHLWKKSMLLVYNRLRCHRYASTFLNPIRDEIAPQYSSAIKRPMDLKTIARNLRSGVIRSTDQFHRDLLLMLVNATMYNSTRHAVHHMARDLLEEVKYQLGILLTVHENRPMNESRSPRLKRQLSANNFATSTPPKKAKRSPTLWHTPCYVKMENIDLTDTFVFTKPSVTTPIPRKTRRIKVENTYDSVPPPITVYSRRKSCVPELLTEKKPKSRPKADKSNLSTPESVVQPAKRIYSSRKSIACVKEAKEPQKTGRGRPKSDKLNDSTKDSGEIKPAKRKYTRKSVLGIIETKDTQKSAEGRNKSKNNDKTNGSDIVKPAKRKYTRKSVSSVVSMEAKEVEKQTNASNNSVMPAKRKYTRKSVSSVVSIEAKEVEKQTNLSVNNVIPAKRKYTRKSVSSVVSIEAKEVEKQTNLSVNNVIPAKRKYTRKSVSSVVSIEAKEVEKQTNASVNNVMPAKRKYTRKSVSSVVSIEANEVEKQTHVSDKSVKPAKRKYTRKSCGAVVETKEAEKQTHVSDESLEAENSSPLKKDVYCIKYTVPLKDTTDPPIDPPMASKVHKRRCTIGDVNISSSIVNKKETKSTQKPKNVTNKISDSEKKPKRETKPKLSQSTKKDSKPPNENAEKLAEMLLNVSTCFENMKSEDEAHMQMESSNEDVSSPIKSRRHSTRSCHEDMPTKSLQKPKPLKRDPNNIESKTIKKEPKQRHKKEKEANVNAVNITDTQGKKREPKGPRNTMKYIMKESDISALDNTSLLTPKKRKYTRKIDLNVPLKKRKYNKKKVIDTVSQIDESNTSAKAIEGPSSTKDVKTSKHKLINDHKMKPKLPKTITIKREKGADRIVLNIPSVHNTDTMLAETSTTSTETTGKKVQILSCDVIDPQNIFKDSETESPKFVHSTPKKQLNVTIKQENIYLATAITTESMRDLTRDEACVIKKTLEDTIMDISMDAKRFAPKFRGKPIIADGVVKLWCEDDNTLKWLENIVAKIKTIPDLVICKQSELPKKIKCAILLPGNEDFEVIKRLLKAQNPWAMVDSWLYHSIEQRGENMYLVVGIPSTVIPALEGKERMLAYSLGSVNVQFLKEDGSSPQEKPCTKLL